MEKHNQYPQSMVQQGITTKKELQRRLQDIFEKVEHQESALVKIYQLLFPDWERIHGIQGHPTVGREMWEYIANLFIDLDQHRHPQFFKGGLWIDSGFSSSDSLDGWGISLENCKVIYA